MSNADVMNDVHERAAELQKAKARERRASNLSKVGGLQSHQMNRRASLSDPATLEDEIHKHSAAAHYAIYDGQGNDRHPANAHDAAEVGNLEALRSIVQQGGFHVDEYDRFGRTALMIAAEQGHTQICEELMHLGANVLLEDKHNKRTAIHWAARMGQYGPMHVLCAHIDNEKEREDAVNAEDNTGVTPVFLASQRGQEGEKCVQELLMNGARYNSTKINTKTAGNVILAGIRMKRMLGGLAGGLVGNPAPEGEGKPEES